MPELPSNNVSDIKQPVARTADDVLDIFNSEPDEPEVRKSGADDNIPDVDKDDDDDKKKKDDLELVEPDEDVEKLDLTKTDDDDLEINAPPRKKEILKEYPELFKKFPFLEKILYRDKEYTELFGSFDDAKDIAEKADIFTSFENQLLAGNTEEILKNVKETDERAFNIIVDDYLPTLLKVDKEAYFHVVGNLNKRLIMEMVAEANETGDDDLKQAALIVNKFIFSSQKFTPPQNRVDRSKDEVKNEVEEERLNFVKERFESSRDELQSQVDNTLRATITEYIDPKGTMSPYVKKNAVNDALRMLTASIGRDQGTVKNLDKLWRTAFDSKFSKDSLNRIKSFYLGRAKPNLRNAILKARAEALKDAAPREKRNEEPDEENSSSSTRRTIPTGRTSQPRKSNGMNKGESVTDFFMRD